MPGDRPADPHQRSRMPIPRARPRWHSARGLPRHSCPSRSMMASTQSNILQRAPGALIRFRSRRPAHARQGRLAMGRVLSIPRKGSERTGLSEALRPAFNSSSASQARGCPPSLRAHGHRSAKANAVEPSTTQPRQPRRRWERHARVPETPMGGRGDKLIEAARPATASCASAGAPSRSVRCRR